MSPNVETGVATVFPAMRYNDAPRAMDFLERAFGFERILVVPGENGAIAHAELKLGTAIVMVSSACEDEFRLKSPKDLGATTVVLCVYVKDVDAHYHRAVAAGAEVVRPLADTHYGAREYGVRDPEEQLWFFSTYLPDAS